MKTTKKWMCPFEHIHFLFLHGNYFGLMVGHLYRHCIKREGARR